MGCCHGLHMRSQCWRWHADHQPGWACPTGYPVHCGTAPAAPPHSPACPGASGSWKSSGVGTQGTQGIMQRPGSCRRVAGRRHQAAAGRQSRGGRKQLHCLHGKQASNTRLLSSRACAKQQQGRAHPRTSSGAAAPPAALAAASPSPLVRCSSREDSSSWATTSSRDVMACSSRRGMPWCHAMCQAAREPRGLDQCRCTGMWQLGGACPHDRLPANTSRLATTAGHNSNCHGC